MKLTALFAARPTLSFEVFPPKPADPLAPLFDTLRALYAYAPDFISCTYGAGGTNRKRSLAICRSIKDSGFEAVAHFTCVGSRTEAILSALADYRRMDIKNLLILRGDFPPGQAKINGDFCHADELIRFLTERDPSVCLGGACYPEKHADAPSLEADIRFLLSKQQSGASYFISQMCYAPEQFLHFREKARAMGVTVPILVGVMPVFSAESVLRMTSGNGCCVPAPLQTLIDRWGNDGDSFLAAGKEYTAELIRSYQELGVDGLHLYTMNRNRDVTDILDLVGITKSV